MNTSHKKKLILMILFMSTLVRKGIHFCYKKFVEPYSVTEDDRRHEYILNIVLSGFIGLVTAFGISLVITHVTLGATGYQIPIGAYVVIFGFFIGLLITSRKGHFKVATYIFLILYLLITTSTALMFGVELPMVMVSYVVIIIMSGILLGSRFGVITTLIICGIITILGYLQIIGITNPDTTWRNTPILFSDTVQLSVAFLLITLLTWLSNREIETSLFRARKSEHDLITERDNLEITVAERTHEIKALQAEKVAQLYRSAEFGRLSSGLFHDLMNPLNALIANVDRLKTNPDNMVDVEIYLQKSVSASRRMSSFLDSIRKQISRNANLENFSCEIELLEATDVLAYRAREANVVLEIKHLDDIQLFGNPLKFHQITLNLIANAIDAYKDLNKPNQIVEISLIRQSNTAVLIVSDYGMGISAKLIDTIFDPFFTTKDIYHGTGLGLSTTKNIVERDFNGFIQVDSLEEVQSTFTVHIPLD